MSDPFTMFVVAVAVSYMASVLLAPKPPSGPLDDSKTEPSIRGTLAPLLLGRLLTGPVIGYVGDRTTKKEKVGGGGKGGGKSQKQTVYFEKGMHIISVGPGKGLNAIYQNGKLIFPSKESWFSKFYGRTTSAIDPTSYPSGSSISLGKEGQFRIYWGEVDQPIDSLLSEKTGLSSRYPYTMYVVWDRKRLGPTAIWPQLEYDVEVETIAEPADGEYVSFAEYAETLTVTVQDSSAAVDLTGYTSLFDTDDTTSFAFLTTDSLIEGAQVGYGLAIASIDYGSQIANIFTNGSNYYIFTNTFISSAEAGNGYSSDVQSTDGRGVNPSSALYQMLFSTWPHGLGIPQSRFDMTSFDTLATLFKTTEPSPCTIFLKSGRSFRDGMVSVMQDFGVFFSKDTTTGKYGVKAIREGETPTAISASSFNNNELARVLAYATLDPDKLVFSFKDSARKFADSTILISNDGAARYSQNPNTRKVALNTVTDLSTASRVSSRREQEASIDEALTVELAEEHKDLLPGELITLEGFSEEFRLAEKTPNPDSAKFQASLMLDSYSTTNNYEQQSSSGIQPVNIVDPSLDPVVLLLEGNRYLNPDQDVFYFLRIRRHGQMVGSELYTSKEGSTYDLISETVPYAMGGVLSEQILDTAAGIIETGPTITLSGPDITEMEDLTGNDPLWTSGYQLAFIGSELFFLRRYNASTGRLEGLIRARAGTKPVTHAVGTKVLLLRSNDLEVYTANYLLNGSSLYAKSLPYTDSGQIPADEVTAEQITYNGGGFRPLSPENLTTDDLTSAWVAGADVDIRWDYKNALDKSGAGIGESDVVSSLAGPEGYFRLEILNGSTVVRTVDNLSLGAYTYTNANLVSDFSGEPSAFNARVVNILNGLISEQETATFTKV